MEVFFTTFRACLPLPLFVDIQPLLLDQDLLMQEVPPSPNSTSSLAIFYSRGHGSQMVVVGLILTVTSLTNGWTSSSNPPILPLPTTGVHAMSVRTLSTQLGNVNDGSITPTMLQISPNRLLPCNFLIAQVLHGIPIQVPPLTNTQSSRSFSRASPVWYPITSAPSYDAPSRRSSPYTTHIQVLRGFPIQVHLLTTPNQVDLLHTQPYTSNDHVLVGNGALLPKKNIKGTLFFLVAIFSHDTLKSNLHFNVESDPWHMLLQLADTIWVGQFFL